MADSARRFTGIFALKLFDPYQPQALWRFDVPSAGCRTAGPDLGWWWPARLALVETAHNEAWAVWFNERFDEAVRTRLINGFGEALGQSRIDMRNEFKAEDKKLTEENRRLAKTIEDLRVEVAELRGELKVLRAAGTSKLWRPD